MTKLHGVARIKIHPGKLEAFQQAVAECVALTREKNPGTLRYEWYLNDEQTVCTLLETYESSEAVLIHLGNLGDAIYRLLACGELSGEIFGNPSSELRQAVAEMPIKFYPLWQGLGA